jgi:hypothetical protein
MIGYAQTLKSFNNCLQAHFNNGQCILFSKLNEIALIANVSDQSARKYKENVSTETEGQGSVSGSKI